MVPLRAVEIDGKPHPKIKDLGHECVLLAEGAHTFGLQRQDGSTATLHFTVRAEDEANILVLEFRTQKVQTDTDPGVQCPEE